MKSRNMIGIGIIIFITIVVGVFILSSKPQPSVSSYHGHGHGHGATSHDDDRGHEGETHSGNHGHDHGGGGLHGGRLFQDGHFRVEVVIYEDGVPPQFRIYCYEDGKPVDPNKVSVSIEMTRLGDRITHFRFEPKGEFSHSDTIVDEPHSFDVLVKAKYEGKAYEWSFSQIEARIKLLPEVANTVGIHIDKAGPARIQSFLELPGEVILNADKVCHVVPRVAGVVSESHKNLGDQVKAGEIIALIDSRELADTRSRYLVHLKREELAMINFERIRKLWEKKVSPEKELLDAKKAYEEEKIERLAAAQKLKALGLSNEDLKKLREKPDSNLSSYELRAPFDGVVITKHMSKGEWVDEKADILCVADLSSVWVDITVYPNDIDAVRVGQLVTVKADSSNLEAKGNVSYVGPLVGEKSRTAKARVVINNPDSKWRPGMFVTVKLVKSESDVPVAVKHDAVQTLVRFGTSVFFRHGDYFEVRPVKLGRSDSEKVEVLKGLSPGEQYASAKSFVIKSELGKEGISHAH